MTLALYIDRQAGTFVKSLTDSAPASLPPFYDGKVYSLVIYVADQNPAGGNTTPYTQLDVTGMSLRVGIGLPAGTGTPIAQQLTFTPTGTTTKHFVGDLSCNTAEFTTFMGTLLEVPAWLEVELSADGVVWDKLVQADARCRATLFDESENTVLGPVVNIDDTDSPYTTGSNTALILADPTSGAIAITLPASPRDGQSITVKDIGGAAASNAITVTPAGGHTIDSLANAVIADNWAGLKAVWSATADAWFLI